MQREAVENHTIVDCSLLQSVAVADAAPKGRPAWACPRCPWSRCGWTAWFASVGLHVVPVGARSARDARGCSIRINQHTFGRLNVWRPEGLPSLCPAGCSAVRLIGWAPTDSSRGPLKQGMDAPVGVKGLRKQVHGENKSCFF